MGQPGIFLSLLLVVGAVGGAASGIAAAQPTVTLTVSVTTPAGESVDAATLTATWDNGSTTAETASNGKAFVDVPEGADVSIAVDHPDYVRNAPYQVADASERDVSITVYEAARATIAVEDAEGPVDGASVTMAKGGTTVLDAETTDGTVKTGTIEAGEYDVRVAKPGYYTKTLDVTVENDTTRTIAIERGSVSLVVNVTDDYFDPPRGVAGATAEVGDVGTIKTQSNGVQRISVPVNTRLNVSVTKDGYQTVTRSVDVDESDVTLAVDLARTPALEVDLMSDRVVVGERVLVRVTDEYGDPVPNATVRMNGSAVATTGPEGTATVTVESAGDHAVTVTTDSLTSPAVTVTGVVPAGTTTTSVTTAPTTDAQTTRPTTTGPVPGFGWQLAIVGIALVAVLFGIRAWQRG
ncbi:MAG: hypothetical protein ABEJ76_00400 [Halanaeroarchaeum sp.]